MTSDNSDIDIEGLNLTTVPSFEANLFMVAFYLGVYMERRDLDMFRKLVEACHLEHFPMVRRGEVGS